jgi:hypothetical protein
MIKFELIKNEVDTNYLLLKTIVKKESEKEELTELEKDKQRHILKQIDYLERSTKLLSKLTVSTNSKINEMILLKESSTMLFSYIPEIRTTSRNSKRRIKDVINSPVILKRNSFVTNGLANGNNLQTNGVSDDVTNYIGEPTVNITSFNNIVNFQSKPIFSRVDGDLSISFEFKLNRFPSKILYRKGQTGKQITTRRSDIISFEFNDGSSRKTSRIEFGAMAPKVIVRSSRNDKISRLYTGNYSPFSIAACITGNSNRSSSIYTDYKFRLGVTYLVTLGINTDLRKFGEPGNYNLSLKVNNIVERVISENYKVWRRKSNISRKNNTLASAPGFKLLNQDSETNNDILENSTINPTIIIHGGFDFNNLYKITASPLKIIKRLIDNIDINKSIYNKKTYRVNTGIDFGKITIYGKVRVEVDKKVRVEVDAEK